MSKEELDDFARSLPAPPDDDARELLAFCSGIDGMLDQIDFSGRTLQGAFEAEFVPYGLPIAHDGFGNYWVIDLQPECGNWGPIYFCCHDAPVMLLQASTLQQFVHEVVKMYTPPNRSLIDDVHEDRLFDVWRKNPGIISRAEAIASAENDIRTFAAGLDSDFEIIDLRNAPVGMGFSHGRYGWRTEVRRFGPRPIFAYRKPEKKSLVSRLLGR